MTDDAWPLEADFTDVSPIDKIKKLKEALVESELEYKLTRVEGDVVHVNVYVGDND